MAVDVKNGVRRTFLPQNLQALDRWIRHPFQQGLATMALTSIFPCWRDHSMPYIQLFKVWTPLELFGIQLFRSEEKHWYIKRSRRPLRSLKGRQGE